ncbi:hypothetical protein BH11CYA1_BH11CYA1_44610 [soil metagenome]
MSSDENAIQAIKLLHAGLSVAGFASGVAILYFGRPGITVRTAVVAASALTLVSSILLGGDLFATVIVDDRFTTLRRLGWFALGLLFGAGRGDRIVNWIRPPVVRVFTSEPVFPSVRPPVEDNSEQPETVQDPSASPETLLAGPDDSKNQIS